MSAVLPARAEFLALPPDGRAEVVAMLREEGRTFDDAACALGVSRATITRLRPLLPPQLRGSPVRWAWDGRTPVRRRALALLDLFPRLSAEQLAVVYDCSLSTARYCVRRWRALQEERADRRCPVCEFPFEPANPECANGWCAWCALFYAGYDVEAWHRAGRPRATLDAALAREAEAAARVAAVREKYGITGAEKGGDA